MKKIKFLFLLISLCFMTGCTATYDLNITANGFKEKLVVSMNNSEYTAFLSDNNNKYVNMYYDDPNNIGTDGVKLPLPGVKYYDFSSNDNNKSVVYSGSFSEDNFDRSSMLVSGFSSVKVSGNSDEIHLKSSKGFMFLYDELTSVKVRITSPYRVLYSNADAVSGNTLVWNITKANAANKVISVDYSKNDEPNYETDEVLEDEEDIKNEEIVDVPQDDDSSSDASNDENSDDGNETGTTILVVVAGGLLVFSLIVLLVLSQKKRKLEQI